MTRKRILLAGALLLAAAACLAGYNLWENYRAGENVVRVVAAMRRAEGTRTPAPARESAGAEESSEEELPASSPDPAAEMPESEIDGHCYIGTLDIPSLELSLPIMASWSYPDLKLAPCRYAGSAYRDDMVVAGHNYTTHFGPLGRLRTGDGVLFTDVEGNGFSYTVACLEELPPTAVEEMTAGEWDLTLFTCTLSGKARLAVRCVREDPLSEEPEG